MARWPSQPTQRPPTKLAWRNRRSARANRSWKRASLSSAGALQASAIAEKCKSPMTDKLSVSAVVDEKSCVPPPGAYRFYSMSPGRHRAAFVPASGQCWTTLGGLRGTHTSKFRRLDRLRHSRSAVARGTCTFPLAQQTPGQDTRMREDLVGRAVGKLPNLLTSKRKSLFQPVPAIRLKKGVYAAIKGRLKQANRSSVGRLGVKIGVPGHVRVVWV